MKFRHWLPAVIGGLVSGGLTFIWDVTGQMPPEGTPEHWLILGLDVIVGTAFGIIIGKELTIHEYDRRRNTRGR